MINLSLHLETNTKKSSLKVWTEVFSVFFSGCLQYSISFAEGDDAFEVPDVEPVTEAEKDQDENMETE